MITVFKEMRFIVRKIPLILQYNYVVKRTHKIFRIMNLLYWVIIQNCNFSYIHIIVKL